MVFVRVVIIRAAIARTPKAIQRKGKKGRMMLLRPVMMLCVVAGLGLGAIAMLGASPRGITLWSSSGPVRSPTWAIRNGLLDISNQHYVQKQSYYSRRLKIPLLFDMHDEVGDGLTVPADQYRGPWYRLWYIHVNIMTISGILLAIPSIVVFRQRRKKRIGPPACHECGYNLTGNNSGKCPECGTMIEASVS